MYTIYMRIVLTYDICIAVWKKSYKYFRIDLLLDIFFSLKYLKLLKKISRKIIKFTFICNINLFKRKRRKTQILQSAPCITTNNRLNHIWNRSLNRRDCSPRSEFAVRSTYMIASDREEARHCEIRTHPPFYSWYRKENGDPRHSAFQLVSLAAVGRCSLLLVSLRFSFPFVQCYYTRARFTSK